jgi:predicted transcriptional regulator
MCLDFFDRKILGVLTKKGEPLTLAELVRGSGFVRSTVIIHLERLGSEGLVLKEKKPSEGRGRPEFLYRPAGTPQPEAAPQLSAIVTEFSKLKKACRYEKGGYCKLARDACATQNASGATPETDATTHRVVDLTSPRAVSVTLSSVCRRFSSCSFHFPSRLQNIMPLGLSSSLISVSRTDLLG